MGQLVTQGVQTLRVEHAALFKELSIISGKVRHVSWAKVLVSIGSTIPFRLTVQPFLRMLGLEKTVEALSSAVVVSTAFVVGKLQDTEWLGSLSAALFIVLLLSLLVATIDVDVESLQFEIVNDPTAATQTTVISQPLERRSLFGDNTAPTATIKVSFAWAFFTSASPTDLFLTLPFLFCPFLLLVRMSKQLSVPSSTSWKEVSQRRIQSPKSGWLTGGSASFFGRLNRSGGKAATVTATASKGDYQLSTNGLKQWSPPSAGMDPLSPAHSLTLQGATVSPLASSAQSPDRNVRRSKTVIDRSESNEVTLTDDSNNEGFTQAAVGGKVRRSLSTTDTNFDPRSVIGWQVVVQGQGKGVVKDVRRSMFGKIIFDVDFGTGKVSKVSLKKGAGLPFTLVRNLLDD